METVKYSLNNIIYNKTPPNENTISIKQKFYDKTYVIKPNNTHLFDKYCIELYGEKTCILFHINNSLIEVRLLDKIRYEKNHSLRYINKNFLYNEIPNLLKNNYTVVLVEQLLNSNTTEITAIHLPPK